MTEYRNCPTAYLSLHCKTKIQRVLCGRLPTMIFTNTQFLFYPSYQILVLKTDVSNGKAVLTVSPFLKVMQRTFARKTTDDNGSFPMDQAPLSTARRLNHHLFHSLTAGIKLHSLVARQPSKLFNTVYILHYTNGTPANKTVKTQYDRFAEHLNVSGFKQVSIIQKYFIVHTHTCIYNSNRK